MRLSRVLLFVRVACLSACSWGQGRFQDEYSKIEYMIPMRDGVKLYTAVYVPKNMPGTHPILMERTPYSAGPYGPTAMRRPRGSIKLQQAGYIFAFQDVRGKEHSEGDYVNIRPELHPGEKGIDESTDTYDTVDYLVKHVPQNNGHVGLWGISYPGFYAGVGGINSHPALTAISPQAPVSNWFVGDDFHHNGVLFLQDGFDFLLGFGQIRPSLEAGQNQPPTVDRGDAGAYQFFLKTGALPNFETNYMKGTVPFWNDMMAHPNYDQWWKDRSLPDHMRNVKCAVLTVGGWFDAEDMWGALNLWKQTKAQNPDTPVYLTMGPWFHGMWAGPMGRTFGDLDFGSNTSGYFQDEIEFPFFEKYLRGQDVPPPAPLTLFETGSNEWKKFDVWPPRDLSKMAVYLGPDGTLTLAKPSGDGSDHYVNDPADPTPYLAKPETRRRTREYMIDDQRWADSRADALTYRSPVEEYDTTVAGPIDVDLFASTTGTDADFVVKVIDVWPSDSTVTSSRGNAMANYEQEVRADIFRGKFRDSYSNPKPFEPGKPTRVHFHLNDLLHTFKKGHRMEVQIQSDWFPLADRNPNRFEDINTAKDSDFQKATITIYRSAKFPTHLTFGVMKN
ncbi:MAG TPA: CocE/NonD family hydrolase [Fimbriimonas sp.]|nr:CocE/NonD family hydrolase [Fimbriimonas sp.]